MDLKHQAGVMFLLSGTGGVGEDDLIAWAERLRQIHSAPPEWVAELIAAEGRDAPIILGKYGVFESAEDYAALAEYCHRNNLGDDLEICSEVYSMWQYLGDDPAFASDVALLLDATNKLYSKAPDGVAIYERFLRKYRQIEGQLDWGP